MGGTLDRGSRRPLLVITLLFWDLLSGGSVGGGRWPSLAQLGLAWASLAWPGPAWPPEIQKTLEFPKAFWILLEFLVFFKVLGENIGIP